MSFIVWQFFLLVFATYMVYSYPSKRQQRLSIADWTNYYDWEPQGTGTYAFGYDVDDPETNNVQFRDEERLPNGTVIGSYGYMKPDGNTFIVRYVADEKGYRATIEDASNHLRTMQPSPILKTALHSNKVYEGPAIYEGHATLIGHLMAEQKGIVATADGGDVDNADSYFKILKKNQKLNNEDQQDENLDASVFSNNDLQSITKNNNDNFNQFWLTDKINNYQREPTRFRISYN